MAITEQMEMNREMQNRRVKRLVMESSLKRLLNRTDTLGRQLQAKTLDRVDQKLRKRLNLRKKMNQKAMLITHCSAEIAGKYKARSFFAK